MIQHLKTVWHYRYFWSSLVKLDLRNRYRKSVLGIGWSMLHPLALTGVFCVVFGGILQTGDWKEFAPYILAGLAIWDFVKGTLMQCCDAFQRGEAYIRQCPLPLTVYTLRTVLGTFIHLMISLALCVGCLMVLQQSAAVLTRIPIIVPAIILMTIFSWSIGTIAAFANSYFHDTKHLIEVITGLLFFLTPIMFSQEKIVGVVGTWIIDINPVALFLKLIADPMVKNIQPEMASYTAALTLTAILFGLACATVSWLQKRLIFQL
jgi:lipopolysaccharide transport system permease protein